MRSTSWQNVEAERVDYAWYNENSGWTTHPVETKLPNELGLYDMSDNAGNWVGKILKTWEPYPSGSYTKPTGFENGFYKAMRGGSCFLNKSNCRIWHRFEHHPQFAKNYSGFRVA